MTTAFIIIGTIFGLIFGALTSYGYDIPALGTLILAVVLFLVALFIHLNGRQTGSHIQERKILLNSALEIIDARTRLTVELVGNFRSAVKKYGYALSEEQNEFVGDFLSAVGDVRINDAELGGDTLTKEARKEFISENREHLDKIEKSREVIERYLHENT